jgi:hypothetical protein
MTLLCSYTFVDFFPNSSLVEFRFGGCARLGVCCIPPLKSILPNDIVSIFLPGLSENKEIFDNSSLENTPEQQCGAAEARRAHNPEVDGSKPSIATSFFSFGFLLSFTFFFGTQHAR